MEHTEQAVEISLENNASWILLVVLRCVWCVCWGGGAVTCIVDSVPHLVTVDATSLVCIVMFKDSLVKERQRSESEPSHPETHEGDH